MVLQMRIAGVLAGTVSALGLWADAAVAQDAEVPEDTTLSVAAAEGAATALACGDGGPCAVTDGAYYIAMPDTLEAGDRLPVLLVLHDTNGDPAALSAAPAVSGLATARGMAVIAPVGGARALPDSEAASGWALAGTHGGGRHEASFLYRVMDDATARFPVDRERVIVTGFGHGGSLTWQLACDTPWIASAFAPRNGGYHTALPEDCAAPAPVLHLHTPVKDGWPLGGDVETTEEAAARVPAQRHLTMASESFGCTGSAAVEGALPDGWDALEWQGCADGASLALVLHDERLSTTERQISLILDWAAALEIAPEAPLANAITAETASN
ncbi:MAG: hypothetical protein AAF577_12365 [Pseudomonadota bacterium]